MVYSYIPLDRILSKLYRDLGADDLQEMDVIEWCGEALDHIGVITMYEKIISICDVKNHSCPLPIGLHTIVQVAVNNGIRFNLEYTLKAIGKAEVSNDSIFYPFTNLDYSSIEYFANRFIALRLANHNLFGSLVLMEDENTMFNGDEYSVVDNMLRFSFKEGQILVVHYRQPLDEKTGYPLIPEVVSVIQAVTSYVTFKYMQRNWYSGRQGYGDKMNVAKQDWHWYCGQAKATLNMPKGVQGYQQLLETNHSMLPDHNRYYGFFGNLAKKYN